MTVARGTTARSGGGGSGGGGNPLGLLPELLALLQLADGQSRHHDAPREAQGKNMATASAIRVLWVGSRCARTSLRV